MQQTILAIAGKPGLYKLVSRGKNYVCQLMSKKGISIYDSDSTAKGIMS